VQVKLSHIKTLRRIMTTYGGVEVYTQEFINSALDGGEWSASRPERSTPPERVAATHFIRGCVGPRISLDARAKRKNFVSMPGIEPSSFNP